MEELALNNSDIPTLSMEGISKGFPGVIALSEARLSVRGGEVMALMGANGAGKSTLMNVLGGVLLPDKGTIYVDGKRVEFKTPHQAAAAGIAFVHQELTMFGTLSVAENIFIDDFILTKGLIDKRSVLEEAKKLLGRVGATIPAEMPVEQLSTGDRQLIEIARALRHNPKIIILDEPTSSLTDRERGHLFTVVRSLKKAGTAVIYITHFLDEIFEVCDRVTVMRDGTTVADAAISEVTSGDVVRLMLGPTADAGRLREPKAVDGEPLVEVTGLSRAGALRDISFSLKPGEIVGLWGLLGSGRTELMRALVGHDLIDAGTIMWRDKAEVKEITPDDLRRRAGFVTEDRRGEGIVATQSLAKNIALPNLKKLANSIGLVDAEKVTSLAKKTISRLSVRTSGPEQAIGTLSGGNQQKVVFGRWLAVAPRIFFLDEPTRGLDVSAKHDIMQLVAELAESGCSVLIISSELDELMRISDRYLVMSRGRIIGSLPGSASQDDLMKSVA